MTGKRRPGQRGDTNHCRFVMEDGSLCGAVHRCSGTHRPGMTRAQHEEGGIHYTRQQQPPSRGEPTGHVPVSGQQRANNVSVRKALVGLAITQQGRFYGARVQEHIRGSQYRVLLRENLGGDHSEPFYASHSAPSSLSFGQRLGIGWSEWEDRTDDLKTDESEAEPEAGSITPCSDGDIGSGNISSVSVTTAGAGRSGGRTLNFGCGFGSGNIVAGGRKTPLYFHMPTFPSPRLTPTSAVTRDGRSSTPQQPSPSSTAVTTGGSPLKYSRDLADLLEPPPPLQTSPKLSGDSDKDVLTEITTPVPASESSKSNETGLSGM